MCGDRERLTSTAYECRITGKTRTHGALSICYSGRIDGALTNVGHSAHTYREVIQRAQISSSRGSLGSDHRARQRRQAMTLRKLAGSVRMGRVASRCKVLAYNRQRPAHPFCMLRDAGWHRAEGSARLVVQLREREEALRAFESSCRSGRTDVAPEDERVGTHVQPKLRTTMTPSPSSWHGRCDTA